MNEDIHKVIERITSIKLNRWTSDEYCKYAIIDVSHNDMRTARVELWKNFINFKFGGDSNSYTLSIDRFNIEDYTNYNKYLNHIEEYSKLENELKEKKKFKDTLNKVVENLHIK